MRASQLCLVAGVASLNQNRVDSLLLTRLFSVSIAERALETLNYQPLNGKPMRIMWSHRDPAMRRSNVGNIFIKVLKL